MNRFTVECPHCGNTKLYKHLFNEEVYICAKCRFSFSRDFYLKYLKEKIKKDEKKNKKLLFDLTEEI